jgi:hypothetical protein
MYRAISHQFRNLLIRDAKALGYNNVLQAAVVLAKSCLRMLEKS